MTRTYMKITCLAVAGLALVAFIAVRGYGSRETVDPQRQSAVISMDTEKREITISVQTARDECHMLAAPPVINGSLDGASAIVVGDAQLNRRLRTTEDCDRSHTFDSTLKTLSLPGEWRETSGKHSFSLTAGGQQNIFEVTVPEAGTFRQATLNKVSGSSAAVRGDHAIDTKIFDRTGDR
jgi:hypothetical protein